MAQPLIRMYEAFQNAARTVEELEAAGIVGSDISILANHLVNRGTNGMTPDRPAFGGSDGRSRSGAGAGLLARLGLVTISDVGPVAATGWLTSPASDGASVSGTGGLNGTLTGAGVNERRARLYANGLRGGATLLAVRSDGAHHASTEAILRAHGPIDPEVYDLTRRYGGWNGARSIS